MIRCCSCGVADYEELLEPCRKCKSTFIHAYCMKHVEFIVADNWMCDDCHETTIIDEAILSVSRSLQSKGKSHLASPEKSCNGIEISENSLANSKHMDGLATLQPRGKKRRKKRHVQEQLPSADPEPSVELQSSAKSPVHALAVETISNPSVSTQVILHDSEHIKRYDNLTGRKIYNTRYLDEEMLDTLGLREDIEWMAEQVGWTQFLTMKEPTYISLTQEFLSTVKVEIPRRGTGGTITFRLQNKDRQLTIEQFSDIFGFRSGDNLGKPKEYHADEFWSEITDEPRYDPSKAKAIAIYNPCFRVMQRFMAYTIFGRGVTNRSIVRSQELLHLWAMVQRNHNLDTGKYLAQHLQHVGKAAKGSTGEILIGGLITSIARYFNVDMEGLAQATGSNKIDLGVCEMMHMIVCHDGQYKLQLQMINSSWPLPDPAKTTIRIRENWKRIFKGDGRDENAPSQDKVGSSSGQEAQAPEVTTQTFDTVLKDLEGKVDELHSIVQDQRG